LNSSEQTSTRTVDTSLADRVLKGDRLAVARLISMIEDDAPQARAILSAIYPHTGRAHIVGITGPAGSGKSTITQELIREYRKRGLTVGVVAIDPSSSITGGAILGDRIRMLRMQSDPGVFIRSMATRGSLGGLTKSTKDVVRVLDASGKDVVIIETVGVGQDEVDIAKTAQTIVLVNVPGMGDDVQTIKAGILEIADILVINKADMPGVEELANNLRQMLSLSKPPPGGWKVPIKKTIATTGEGISELVDEIQKHKEYLYNSGEIANRAKSSIESEMILLLQEAVRNYGLIALKYPEVRDLIAKVVNRELEPRAAASTLLNFICSKLISGS